MGTEITRVWCTDSPGFGGAELALVRVLKMSGLEESCVLHSTQVSSKFMELLSTNRVTTEAAFPGGNRLSSALSGLRNAFRLISEFREARFIVWCHHLDSNRWLQLALGLSGSNYILAERLVPSHADQLSASRLTVPLKQFAIRRAKAVVLNGFSQRETYRQLFRVSGHNLQVIPNSRPVVQMANQARELRQSKDALRRKLNLPTGPIIVCVGRLSGQKDQTSLIRSLPHLSSGLSSKPTLVLVGDGEAEKQLRELATEIAPNQIVFAGFQSDPLPWLVAADLFVLPSLAEGLPGALLEAMAASLPCIATDIPGNRELIRHEETGLLVPIHDPEALAHAIKCLLSDTALAQRLAQAGHDLIAREYDENVEKAGWEKLFSNLSNDS